MRQEVTFLSGSYGKSRLTPSSILDLGMRKQTHTSMNIWINSCIIGISKRRIIKLSTAANNGKIYPFVLSVVDMLGEEALVILANWN